ncbi:MAG: glycerol kinase GlpK [Pseudomonadota bacterium]
MSRYILALDQGTTSSRALVVAADGSVVASAQREIAQHYPRPGWVEHDAEEIWATQLATATEAMARAGIAPDQVAGLGVTNQRETVVLWDRATGRPLAPAIVWQDRRTSGHCARLREAGAEDRVRALTGLVLDPYFSATKLAWLLEHLPGARAKAEAGELACGTIDTWLVWKLTRGALHATDAGNASRTLLFDLHAGAWSDELCRLFGVPRALLPEVVDSSGVIGHTAADLLGAAIPIAGIAGDQQAALFGQRCTRAGMAKNTYGTGCFMLMHTGDAPVASSHRLLSTLAWRNGGHSEYALEGSVFIAGAVVQWLRDALGVIRQSHEVEALAASVEDAGGVVFVPAFTGLGAPYWDPDARGAILGLSRGTGAAHIARAAVESIAFQSAELLFAMQADAGVPLAELRVDGGATGNDALMQFQADLLGVPVLRPAVTECTALGAALLAGLGTGLWPDASALDAHWKLDRCFEPRMSRDEAGQRIERWQRAVARVRGSP